MLKTGLLIPPSKPTCSHVHLPSSRNDTPSSQLTEPQNCHHLSLIEFLYIQPFVKLFLLLYHFGISQNCSLLSIPEAVTPVYAVTVSHLDGCPVSVLSLPPFLPPPVYSLHCCQGGLSVMQILLLASLSNIFYCYPTGSKDKV